MVFVMEGMEVSLMEEYIDIQDLDQTRRYLKRYRRNISCIDRLKNKLEILEDRITSIKSPNMSGMPRGGTPITIEDLISDKMELESRIHRLEVKGKRIKSETLDIIDSLDNPRQAEVLESFLIDNKSLDDIAEETGYTVRHTYRLYSDGVKACMYIMNESDS